MARSGSQRLVDIGADGFALDAARALRRGEVALVLGLGARST